MVAFFASLLLGLLVQLYMIKWLSFFWVLLWCNIEQQSALLYFMFVKWCVLISSPLHTGFRLFWEAGFLVNPGAHSHVYDPIVLLQTWSERHASDDWHSSTSAKITNKGRNRNVWQFLGLLVLRHLSEVNQRWLTDHFRILAIELELACNRGRWISLKRD